MVDLQPQGAVTPTLPVACVCCGKRDIAFIPVLSQALIAAWELAPEEVAYIDRQQGVHCRACGATLRCWTLAHALMRARGFAGLFCDFAKRADVRALRVLEINDAGGLAPLLRDLPRYTQGRYPTVDMMRLPYDDGAFDLVIHADTLEHIGDPRQGLAECCRVLGPAGVCAFTVPVVVGRLSKSRHSLPPSYHGSAAEGPAFLVWTEFGADIWTYVLAAGFAECRVVANDFPTAHAWLAIKDR